MGKVRTSHYLPNKTRNQKVVIQPEDVEMLDIVYQYPAINTKHLTLLIGGTYKRISNRARRLVNNGMLLRSHAQHVAYWKEGVNEPASHFMSSLAKQVLAKERGYMFPKSNYDRIAEEKVNYSHERNLADIHVRLTLGAKAKGIVYVPRKPFVEGAVSKEALLKYPFKTNTKTHNWELCRLNLGTPGKPRYLQPDEVCALVPDKVRLLFWEVDQNTIPNTSPDSKKTIQRMFENYVEVFKRGLFQIYKSDNMRVIFVTTSDNHIRWLMRLVADAPAIFYFSTLDKIKEKSNILEVQFLTNKGELRTLV
jgi:hypothetical protein